MKDKVKKAKKGVIVIKAKKTIEAEVINEV
jgi:hypothetical protein